MKTLTINLKKNAITQQSIIFTDIHISGEVRSVKCKRNNFYLKFQTQDKHLSARIDNIIIIH